jgi:hypothetical protein
MYFQKRKKTESPLFQLQFLFSQHMVAKLTRLPPVINNRIKCRFVWKWGTPKLQFAIIVIFPIKVAIWELPLYPIV